MKKNSINILEHKYDRVAKEDNPPVYKKGDRFALIDGFYINEDETVSFKSTNDTGVLFDKINTESDAE